MVNIDPYFPCKKCGHMAKNHYITVCDGDGVCTDCSSGSGFVEVNEQFHDFEGDNLKYMELQAKRQALRNE